MHFVWNTNSRTMAKRSFRPCILFIFVDLLSISAQPSDPVTATWCTTSLNEQRKCQDMRSNFTRGGIPVAISCSQAEDTFACMRLIRDNKADLMRIGDNDIYPAFRVYGLQPIMAEKYVDSNAASAYRYKAVAVVKTNGKIRTIDDLKGKKSCHTQYGGVGGWKIPLAGLMSRGDLKVGKCGAVLEATEEFFSKSCVPGAKRVENIDPTNLCALCSDPKSCSIDDNYSGFVGAFRCLHENGGDVAFVNELTISLAQYFYRQRGDPVPDEGDYRLLCSDGSLKNTSEWMSCNWGTRPSGVVVSSKSKSDSDKLFYKAILNEAWKKFGPWQLGFNMFRSREHDGDDLLFNDATKRLVALQDHETVDKYLDSGYLKSIASTNGCDATMRWCVTPQDEQKCQEISAITMSSGITTAFSCVTSHNKSHCFDKLYRNEVDLFDSDALEILAAARFRPNAAIRDVTSDPHEYSLAIALRRSNVTLKNLKGKKICHADVGTSAGWYLPMSYLASNGDLDLSTTCDIQGELSKFYGPSCIPGICTIASIRTPNAKLCELCGDSENDTNRYFGYLGAFRCLVEQNADVAFVNQDTMHNILEKSKSLPYLGFRTADYELLCADGKRDELTQWKTCSVGKTKAKYIVTNVKASTNHISFYLRVLSDIASLYGRNGTKGKKHMSKIAGERGMDFIDDDIDVKIVTGNALFSKATKFDRIVTQNGAIESLVDVRQQQEIRKIIACMGAEDVVSRSTLSPIMFGLVVFGGICGYCLTE